MRECAIFFSLPAEYKDDDRFHITFSILKLAKLNRQRWWSRVRGWLGTYFNGNVKFAAGCDDIIRQHKAACLRVTALLACNELLWIGTSAGVLLTVPIPHIKPSTQRMSQPPIVTGAYWRHILSPISPLLLPRDIIRTWLTPQIARDGRPRGRMQERSIRICRVFSVRDMTS